MAGDVYKIQDEEIKPDALYNAVLADSDGAVTTFAGVVRDNTKGRGTSYLVYDAYRDMAEKKMREIGDEVKEKWEVDCVGILHRVGRLEIGEISVLIAVSSPHRKASLEACHYAIDRLKQTVPIWKKRSVDRRRRSLDRGRPICFRKVKGLRRDLIVYGYYRKKENISQFSQRGYSYKICSRCFARN